MFAQSANVTIFLILEYKNDQMYNITLMYRYFIRKINDSRAIPLMEKSLVNLLKMFTVNVITKKHTLLGVIDRYIIIMEKSKK